MKILKEIYNLLFPEMFLDERIREFCSLHNKDISYGNDLTHEKLNQIGFPKRKFLGKFFWYKK